MMRIPGPVRRCLTAWACSWSSSGLAFLIACSIASLPALGPLFVYDAVNGSKHCSLG